METWCSEPPKSAKRKRNRRSRPFPSWSSALGTFAPSYKGPARNAAVRQRNRNSRSNLNYFLLLISKRSAVDKPPGWVTSASPISRAPSPGGCIQPKCDTGRETFPSPSPQGTGGAEPLGKKKRKIRGKPSSMPGGGQTGRGCRPPPPALTTAPPLVLQLRHLAPRPGSLRASRSPSQMPACK